MNSSKKNNKNKYYLLFLLFFLSFSIVLGQEQQSILKFYSNPINHNYWWLEQNNYGKSTISNEIEYRWTLKKPKTIYQLSFSNAYKSYTSEYPIRYVGLVKYNIRHRLLLGESFIKHNFSDKIFLRVGKYYRDFSQYLNDDLSSGSMLISKNAQAMPKIGLVGSYNIKKNKNITFNLGIAHGIFDKEGYYTDAPFLHEKFLYININKNNYEVGIGLVHEAMWAGTPPELGNLPDTFKDFLKVFLSEDGPYTPPHANALGSHMGIWDFYYQKKKNNQILKLYYQHFFEDTSSFRFRNEIDGLWGIELENYIPNTTILFEYLDTSHSRLDPPYQDDYYYWNYQYRVGWKYKNKIIGNPFVDTNHFSEREFIKLFHIGVSGKVLSNYYELKASKRINMNDTIRYKIKIGKIVKDKFDFNVFMVNNSQTNELGIGISYLLKIFQE